MTESTIDALAFDIEKHLPDSPRTDSPPVWGGAVVASEASPARIEAVQVIDFYPEPAPA